MSLSPLRVAAVLVACYATAIAAAPLVYAGPHALLEALSQPRFARAAALSIATAAISSLMAVVATAPAALYVARRHTALARGLQGASLLLLGMPPVGLGLSLLILQRLHPFLAYLSEDLGLTFTLRAIVIAQFTAVLPLAFSLQVASFAMVPGSVYMLADLVGYRGVLGWLRLYAPILAPAIAGAWLLSFFRALGEFGATLVLAGSTPGYTETIPVAIYNMLSLADLETASALLSITVVIGVLVVALHYIVTRRWEEVMTRL